MPNWRKCTLRLKALYSKHSSYSTQQSHLGNEEKRIKSLETVETQVGMTRYGNLSIRVGCSVIAVRYSENTHIERLHNTIYLEFNFLHL